MNLFNLCTNVVVGKLIVLLHYSSFLVKYLTVTLEENPGKDVEMVWTCDEKRGG